MKNDVIGLTRALVAQDTINPPGNEASLALMVGKLLAENGFKVEYVPFGPDRLHVIAERGLDEKQLPIVFTGHFDTVPLGNQKWTMDPFAGEIKDGKIYGRGTTDMKGAVAAMTIAAIEAFEEGTPSGGIRLVLTAGEELGCQGAMDLVKTYTGLGQARGIIVGEPTGNIPAIGHKGALYLNLEATGITAHSSMPQLGDNAIYKVARAIVRMEQFDFRQQEDPLLGYSTINVGKVSGGLNINSVPDRAGFTIDARITSNLRNNEVLEQIKKELGNDIDVEVLVNLPAVANDPDTAFIHGVYDACGTSDAERKAPKTMPYLTDGSVLQRAYGGIPTVIIGPGEPQMAHKIDEYCEVSKLEQAVDIYKKIICNT
ncbi:M20 family metallopeptidase [Flagellimonas amoyensis]|uniref:M20 family metallopeptidase n=1 Tax=Flagellimonas amoyensis TaxID=2169401 RepID=UPI000D3B8866|nr:M20 family metallopeptidase [Allomuricauda amoyensis]